MHCLFCISCGYLCNNCSSMCPAVFAVKCLWAASAGKRVKRTWRTTSVSLARCRTAPSRWTPTPAGPEALASFFSKTPPAWTRSVQTTRQALLWSDWGDAHKMLPEWMCDVFNTRIFFSCLIHLPDLILCMRQTCCIVFIYTQRAFIKAKPVALRCIRLACFVWHLIQF